MVGFVDFVCGVGYVGVDDLFYVCVVYYEMFD